MHVRSRALRAALVASLVAAPALLPAQGAPKFATVDTKELLDKAPGRDAADAQWKKEMTAMQEQVQKMQDSLQAMITSYQKAEAGLSAPQKEARQKTIADKEQEYQTRTQALDLQAQQRQAQLLQPIIDQIKLALEETRKEQGLTMIFDVNGQTNQIVAWDKNLEVTQMVLVKLRSMPAPAVAMPTASQVAPNAAKPAGPVAAPAGAAKPKIPPTR